MEQRKMKEAKLAELKASLLTVEGRPTEVYSRIVGYYRSVRNWNPGKREEFGKRREYAFPSSWQAQPVSAREDASARGEESRAAPAGPSARPTSYLLFTRRTCPNCPPVKEWLMGSGLQGIPVDVDSADGLDLARQYEVLATPTVVLLDSTGEECGRCYTRAQLLATLSPVPAAVLA